MQNKTTKAGKASTGANAAVAALLAHSKGSDAWPKAAGAKPTGKALSLATALGAKPGSNKWLALAMYARPGGATQPQVCAVLKGPHLNCWRELPEKARGQHKEGKHWSYTVELQGQLSAK